MDTNERNIPMRITKASDYIGVTPQTLRKYAKNGTIPYLTTPGGQLVFERDELDRIIGRTHKQNETIQHVAFYIRSSNGNKVLMDTQEQELTRAYGKPDRTYRDKASGLNEHRKGLSKALRDAESGIITNLCVTNRDRLTRFGYSYVEQLFNDRNCTITVLSTAENNKTAHEELMQDFMSLIASFSGKYYRLRSTKEQKHLLEEANVNIDRRVE